MTTKMLQRYFFLSKTKVSRFIQLGLIIQPDFLKCRIPSSKRQSDVQGCQRPCEGLLLLSITIIYTSKRFISHELQQRT